jgi:type IV pilus assembly protein PilV
MKTSVDTRGSVGYSLVEVMVAVVVICIGVLGIAKLQALSLSNATTSRLRSLAAMEAASLASAMHSNRQYWGDTPPASINVAANVITSSDGALQAAAGAGLTACIGSNNGNSMCTPVALAGYDVEIWVNDLNGLLPNPTATILCPPLATSGPASCTIQMSWSEQAVNANQQEAGETSAVCGALGQGQCFERPTYTLYVEP